MTAFLTAILGPTWAARLAAWGAALLAVLGAVGMIYRAGRKGAEADEMKRTLDHAQDAADARRSVDALPDGGAVDQLQQRWSRD